ncbi:MAG: hypothetical protein NVS1B11_31610 [Terriglobales bacterium]
MPIEQLEKLIEELESSSDDATRDQLHKVVTPLLELHREALRLIIELLRQQGHEPLIRRLLQDPLLESLLRGYGLVDDEAWKAETTSPLASRMPSKPGMVPLEALLATVPGNKPKKWLPLLHEFELKAGQFLKIQLFDEEVLIVAIGSKAFAFKNRCPGGDHGLEDASLDGLSLTCSCHGLRFDLRTGSCSERPGLKLEVMPVTVENGVVRVAYE